MNTMDSKRLEEIEARASAATMWSPDECYESDPQNEDDLPPCAPQGAHLGDTLVMLDHTYDNSRADWSFLAHVREDVPALVERIRELENGLAQTLEAVAFLAEELGYNDDEYEELGLEGVEELLDR